MYTPVKMPLWGPYSKKYMGLSHIPAQLGDIGARFDFTVHPTVWNANVPVPNVTVPSNYHLMACAPDFSYYAYRYELIWKDRLYADISFSKMGENAYLMRCEYVNDTSLSQNCILNFFASLEFPFYDEARLSLPAGAVLKNANDYSEYTYAVPRPWDGENPDGMFKGMFRDPGFYLACGLGDRCDHSHVEYLNLKPFGCEKGDRVSYKLSCGSISDPVLLLRYRTVTPGDALFTLNGQPVTLPHSDTLTFAELPYRPDPVFESLGAAGVEFDFLAVTNRGEKIGVSTVKRECRPALTQKESDGAFVFTLQYPYEGCRYTLITHNPGTRLRELDTGCLEDALVNRLSNGDPTYDDLTETFTASFRRKHSDDGYFVNPTVKSIFIAPGERHTEYAVIALGDVSPLTAEEYERIYLAAKRRAGTETLNPEGEKYAFSVNILKSTLLTNTVYPAFRRGENTVHHTPGKRWDSFYTWDSGFIGMGMLEYAPELCRYALESYLCDESNADFCFLLHGSLVPTQFAEYYELLKRTPDKHTLDALYPKMKRYYEFLQGRTGGSTFAKFGNGLLTAYDYWYSCSGMDDYPAQVAMIENKAEAYSCPCLTSAHGIIAGKIMLAVARYLGKAEDAQTCLNDIARTERALNDLAWDEESGYFGYTMYDRGGRPYLMRTPDGENFNKGFDGIYPLVAGAVRGERAERLLGHLKNPRELWSRAGLTAVDMTASYYMDDGYWNGNVWMSHQWYIWKAMLDLGEADFAFAIAERALDLWKEETDFSYNTYECFGVRTRRGGWFHNFGGLSSPICIWAHAYYKPGTVTTGFDVWTDSQRADENGAEIRFRYYGRNDRYTVLVTLGEADGFTAALDGEEIPCFMRTRGTAEITLPGSVKQGTLTVKRN